MTKLRLTMMGIALSAFLGASQNSRSGPALAQQSVPSIPRAQFFAGTVVELDTTHIRVTRTLVGHPTESRSFVLTPTTKMNRAAVKLRNHVTVRYKHLPEGDVALEIQPRPVLPRTPKM